MTSRCRRIIKLKATSKRGRVSAISHQGCGRLVSGEGVRVRLEAVQITFSSNQGYLPGDLKRLPFHRLVIDGLHSLLYSLLSFSGWISRSGFSSRAFSSVIVRDIAVCRKFNWRLNVIDDWIIGRSFREGLSPDLSAFSGD